ncbi:valine--tRNA ligase [Desulfosporosinus sp. BICA1-9]|uniref:valine--tRNA ligase n=1 Tax=Desulfosporosinus sp. BICA1-9 TaxID=1531958 RepID=UPI00054BB0BF|nr:valine--tRNA ligase [Desulfosporosinus sp. BICA1-9]KJS86280.1 MAG: hypothetical protein JL57_16865 [Desulfosporosinus sp. BICA1-9]
MLAWPSISCTTFRHWMRQGEEDKKGEYFNFFNAIKAAEAQAEIRAVELWHKQMPQDWRAAQAFLERRYPERWGKRERVEFTGKEGGPIEIESMRARLIEKLTSLTKQGSTMESDN